MKVRNDRRACENAALGGYRHVYGVEISRTRRPVLASVQALSGRMSGWRWKNLPPPSEICTHVQPDRPLMVCRRISRRNHWVSGSSGRSGSRKPCFTVIGYELVSDVLVVRNKQNPFAYDQHRSPALFCEFERSTRARHEVRVTSCYIFCSLFYETEAQAWLF